MFNIEESQKLQNTIQTDKAESSNSFHDTTFSKSSLFEIYVMNSYPKTINSHDRILSTVGH